MTEDEKKKFVFNCTRCGKCCADRGPIPLVMEDLELWAKNRVVANMLPYLKFILTPKKTLDLVFTRQIGNQFEETPEKAEENQDSSCPMYNKEKKECTIYENRPLSCRTYPLEFDGQKFVVVDDECPGIGHGDMTKEDRIKLRELAQHMFNQLRQIRIVMPIVSQAMQTFVIGQLIEQQRQAFEKMTPEERERYQKEYADQMDKK